MNLDVHTDVDYDADTMLTYFCDAPFENYNEQEFDTDADETIYLFESANMFLLNLEENLKEILDDVAAYSATQIRMMSHPEDIVNHLYVDLIDIEHIEADLGHAHPFATRPHPDLNNMAYCFIYSCSDLDMSHRITTNDLKNYNFEITDDVFENALKRTNAAILQNIDSYPLAKTAIERNINPALPPSLRNQLIETIYQDVDELDKTVHAICVRDLPIYASTLILFESALLAIAKKLNAKHMIQIFPSPINAINVRNADASVEYPKLLQRVVEISKNDDTLYSTKYMIYDIINKKLSIIPDPKPLPVQVDENQEQTDAEEQ